jgi:catechol 2,3-dioxygenase-like lactoylglutathione lyase family enzyme
VPQCKAALGKRQPQYAIRDIELTGGAMMLSNLDAIATVGVRDLAAAREFYTNILGLEDCGSVEGDEVLTYRSGHTLIQVYRSDYGGSNKATSVTWNAGARIEETVAALKAKGLRFEHYHFDGMRLEDDFHVGEGIKVVWFKDPDGNILSINGK